MDSAHLRRSLEDVWQGFLEMEACYGSTLERALAAESRLSQVEHDRDRMTDLAHQLQGDLDSAVAQLNQKTQELSYYRDMYTVLLQQLGITLQDHTMLIPLIPPLIENKPIFLEESVVRMVGEHELGPDQEPKPGVSHPYSPTAGEMLAPYQDPEEDLEEQPGEGDHEQGGSSNHGGSYS